MRRLFLAVLVAACAAPLCAAAQPATAAAPAAAPARWNLVLNNVKNLQHDLGANNVTIEIVAYGPGIGMPKFDARTNSRITDATGVTQIIKRQQEGWAYLRP